MYARLLKTPLEHNKSFFLFGPRGSGKTSWIKTNINNSIYLDLLKSDLYMRLSANPGKLEKLIPDNYSDWIVLDEVQKIPLLLNEVHRLIEERNYRFVLTGSSARKLRQHGVNLLAGRAATYHMHPLTIHELGIDFNLQNSLKFGHLPAVFNEDPEIYLQSYVDTFLRQEVMQEGLTRNLAAFNRFLETASFSQGSLLNMSAIAREVGIHQKVITNYFEILEDLLISYRIPPFTKRAKRKVTTHPKFYFFDAGIYRTLRPTGPFDLPEEIAGPALETLFLQELKAVNDYLKLRYSIYFWRTIDGHEVDFIIYGPNGIYAFEIKSATNITSRSLKSLRLFKNDFPEANAYLLYCGNITEYHNGITVMPIEKALPQLAQILKSNIR